MIPHRKIIDRKMDQVRAALVVLDGLDLQDNHLKIGRNIIENWGRLILVMLGKLRDEVKISIFERRLRREYRSYISQTIAMIDRNAEIFFKACSREEFKKIFRGTE